MTEFAAKLGCSTSKLSRISSGKINVTLEFALKIQRVTDGAVRPEDLLSPCNSIEAEK